MVVLNRFGKYEILRKLGRSMTDVYLARDPERDRPVVLKVIERSRENFATVAIQAERRGAALQRQLHQVDRRILEVYDFGEHENCFFVALEYFPGRTLAAILQDEKRLEPRRTARYAAEICSQLRTLHRFAAGSGGQTSAVVHGDIKPSNIQIGADDQLRLLDFGIAKAITSAHNLTNHNLGSPSYCSPERLKESQIDRHADLWALGVTLYELLAGCPPFQAQDTRQLEALIQSRQPPRALPDDCPSELRAIVKRALAGEAAQRYPSAEFLERDLRAFLDNAPAVGSTLGEVWLNTNATVRRLPASAPLPVIVDAKTMEPAAPNDSAKIPDTPAAKLHSARQLRFGGMAVSMLAGLLVGFSLFIPLAYAWRLRDDVRAIQKHKDYTQLSGAELTADWDTYQRLMHGSKLVRSVTHAEKREDDFRRHLITSANSVLRRFRESSDLRLSDFDWASARKYLLYALQTGHASSQTRGELYLCDGYLALEGSKPSFGRSFDNFRRAQELLPRQPDAHLALARIDIYGFHNLAAGLAEFRLAEKFGYRLGARERRQQADGYLFQAEWALARAKYMPFATRQDIAQWLQMAQMNLRRAGDTYKPAADSPRARALTQTYQERNQELGTGTAFKPLPAKFRSTAAGAGYFRKASWPGWR